MNKFIRIKYIFESERYELIGYKFIKPIKRYDKYTGIYIGNRTISIHIPIFVEFYNDPIINDCRYPFTDFIYSVIKRIKRKETINKLLNRK